MKQILITGATGNVGIEVVHQLYALKDATFTLHIATRNIQRAKQEFYNIPELQYRLFDFKQQHMFNAAFKDITILFLLRPPHIAEVNTYFKPLLASAKQNGIENVVFLSVHGAEKSKVIPHNKIERLIASVGCDYVFIRPSYFMQNLTTNLLKELQDSHTITLPSGTAVFNWIDVKDIAEVIAIIMLNFDTYKNKAYNITGTENKNFRQVTAIISKVTGTPFNFININPISFYLKKRKDGYTHGFAIVMTLLHVLPRFQNAPEISNDFYTITGHLPKTLATFIEREKDKIIG